MFKPYQINRNLNVKLDINNVIDANHLCSRIDRIVSTLDTSEIESHYSYSLVACL